MSHEQTKTFQHQLNNSRTQANVLISHHKKAYLCDFGLSRFVVDNTLWRTTATHAGGTLRWMAPELLQQEECLPTKASDIYAYGMTCYVGKLPFEHDHSSDVYLGDTFWKSTFRISAE